MDLDKAECYREVGAFYRHFLSWRHASFAGMIVIVFGSLQLAAVSMAQHPDLASWIPIFAAPVGVLLWVIDLRTRDLYHAAAHAGRKLEGDTPGFYTALVDSGILKGKDEKTIDWNRKGSRVTQSGALEILFLGGSVLLLFSGAVLKYYLWFR